MEIVVSDEVAVSQNGNCLCKKCFQHIKRGLPMLRRSYTNGKYGTVNGFICYKCYEEIINQDMELCKSAIIGGKRLKKIMQGVIKRKMKDILANEIEQSNKYEGNDKRWLF